MKTLKQKKTSSFSWVVRFTIKKTWVADGFNLTDERAKRMLANDLQYASGHEITAKVLKAPEPLRIGKEWGYPTDKEVIKEIKEGELKETI